MLKYQYIKYALCFLMLFAAFSCKKDTGNYDYHEINSVDFSGINSSYNALLGQKFQINPVLKFSLDNSGNADRYSYEWFALNKADVLPAEKRKNLATTRNLDIVLQIPSGVYDVYYNVTDKETGVTYRTTFVLRVETTIYEGWMVMNDVNGNARVDMISKINDQYTTIFDVLGTTGSELALKGKPLSVNCYTYNFSTYGIYFSTDQGTNRVDPETFKWKNTYNLAYEVVANVPAGFHADFLAPVKIETGNSYMYSGGNVYYYFYIYQINYGTPINLVKGESTSFRAAPFVISLRDPATFTATAVMFDVDKKRFLRHNNNDANVSTFSANSLFDFNNVGMDLLHMEYSPFNGGDVFAILKNPAGKIYLARFNASTGIQTYFDEIQATDIAVAEKFAVSPVYGYLFYSAGGKVYEYDTSLKTSKLMLNKGAEKISLMKFHEFGRAGSSRPYYQSRRNQLMVCSYDPALPADKNGKMELFEVPSLNGDLVKGETYSGFGKIVSVDYRER
ncbi:hypothetical protein ABIE26_002626 [Pedobacter africanus]|uniref:Uncharacterized protein n=1 Tax=Pedobacter africanus TaxID=151894 RepID=A0ACC6KX76_9SPHI|nr:PKD-like family lipoprotein [Pedobacter africanus]MDR6783985.1 hypothetical protein [Pedobacter africanus]